ncbi:hypothetical protein HID58_021889 [Brassica napus]|uniref:Uncharacterized protein n=1 Tax=Brassica napus TaxID=3708 RepID=A0ABQ8CXN1_BRANA|nr:hypothetical protein HID58_021889 [Brassica napus]
MTAFVKRSVSSVQSAASHREVSLRQDLQPVSGRDRTQTPHFLGIGLSLSLFPAKFDSYRRRILLLAVMLDHLKLKPLDNAVVHSLIGFFTAKLAECSLCGVHLLVARLCLRGKRSIRCGHAIIAVLLMQKLWQRK